MTNLSRSACVIFRIDANTQIGVGHMMRCIALAQHIILETKSRIHFLMSNVSQAIQYQVTSRGIVLVEQPHMIASVDDARYAAQYAISNGATWVVIDGYQFDKAYLEQLRRHDLRVLWIDDLGTTDTLPVDAVLNQNIYANDSLYPNFQNSEQMFLGLDYVLLRQEFLAYQNWVRPIVAERTNVLVTLGGGDSQNATAQVLRALESYPAQLCIKVVVGQTNPHLLSLQNLVTQSQHQIELLQPPDNMAALMAWAHFCISAAGSTIWEILWMQLPFLMIVTAENQKRNAMAFKGKHGIVTDSFNLQETLRLEGLLNSQYYSNTYNTIGSKTRSLVLSLFLQSDVTLRLADATTDVDNLFEWRNDVVTRSYSLNKEIISRDEHESWLKRVLAPGSNTLLYIAEIKGNPVGTIRMEDKGNFAEISWTVAPNYRGMGIATEMIRKLREQSRNRHPLKARILKGNHASSKVALKAGMYLVGDEGDVLVYHAD